MKTRIAFGVLAALACTLAIGCANDEAATCNEGACSDSAATCSDKSACSSEKAAGECCASKKAAEGAKQ